MKKNISNFFSYNKEWMRKKSAINNNISNNIKNKIKNKIKNNTNQIKRNK